MAVLVVNLGTSDLLVSINGYYLPIGFDRDEKNVNYESITDTERQIWDDRYKLIALKLCPELGIEPKKAIRNNDGEIISYTFDFRKLTKRIWEEYQENTSFWEERLAPGRIAGVIKEAQNKFKVQKAYIFVTDQSTKEKPDYHDGDTCYLFKILNKIMEKEIELIPIVIKKNAIDADSLLETYYDFFNTYISDNKPVLVSIKGGTPQMQTALKMQAIASSIPHLLFIDPQLNISKAQKGESSECIITSYWRYLKTQKYQTVKLLLEKRWDFHGAKVILEEWQNTLNFLKESLKEYLEEDDAQQLKQEQQKLTSINTILKEATDNLNFVSATKSDDILHSVLNLYTQCRIYWELEEIANVLPRLGSFYEESLQVIIRYLSKKHWFKNNNANENWTLIKSRISIRNKNILNEYHKIEIAFDKKIKWYYDDSTKEKTFKLGTRYRKRNFAEALVISKGNDNQKDCWYNIVNDLKKIDFWVDKRNDLIHGTKGLTLETMAQEIENYRNNYSEDDQNNSYKPDPEIICDYKNILGHITHICMKIIELVEQEQNNCVRHGENVPFYLYSDLRDRVIKQLDE